MLLQMGASCMALVACLTAFLVSPSLVVFAILLAFGLLGIFLVQAPLCELPRLQLVSSFLKLVSPPSLCMTPYGVYFTPRVGLYLRVGL